MIELKAKQSAVVLGSNDLKVEVFAPTGETLKSSYDKGYTQGNNDGYESGMQDGYPQGWNDGYSDGEVEGWNEGYTEGWDEGKVEGKAEAESEFWEQFQNGGKRTNYDYAFYEKSNGGAWSKGFSAKYPIIPSSAQYMFHYFGYNTNFRKGFSDFCKENNMTIDLYNTTTSYGANYMFANSWFTSIPKVKIKNLSSTFLSCSYLVTIEEIGTNESNNTITSANSLAFSQCSALEEIRFSCWLDCTGLSFSSCSKLSKDSLLNILEHLKDRSSTTSKTITLGTANKNKLTDVEKAIATEKGWTLA